MKKKLTAFFAAIMIFALSFSFLAFAKRPETRQAPRLVDKAKLIEKSDEQELLTRLDEISEELQFDFVIATVKTTDGKDIETFTDDYFDNNGFGYGSEHNGTALIISMEPRAVYIGGYGEGTEYFDYSDAQSIIDVFYGDLKNGNYASVAETYIDQAKTYVDSGRSGDTDYDYPQDDDYDYSEDDGASSSSIIFVLNWKTYILIPIIVGIILSFITVALMTRGLKSVRKKTSASDYVVPGSMNLTRSEDYFLYRHITRTEIPKSDDSGDSSFGSGGTHISSSGTSSSGGGRSF